jgi:menaquinol-cytochrome c reductase iron-sulfur subunit
MDQPKTACCCCQASGAPGEDRRGFLGKAAGLIVGAVGLLVPAATGLAAFLNPLRQKSEAGKFRKLAALDQLKVGDPPLKVSVIGDRADAWNLFRNVPIGGVYLRRTGKEEVQAFQVVCPHAGCSINYEATPKGGKFFCPCHVASFDLDGKRLDDASPSPRDMDTLEIDEEKLRETKEVWVKFQDFRQGSASKEVLG